ncbi:MAG TPA: HisA/HisF-related TIM barrel protein, partial [Nitrososphaerales archaeon]|nr:HisA/HisF-related TIM barrel protein [Nitrososphaerales archaeon]
VEAAKMFEAAGVVNLLATSVGVDGMATGPDLETLEFLCSSKRLRVIASGGIRNVQDLMEIESRGAAGAIVGRALYDGGVKLAEARSAVGISA